MKRTVVLLLALMLGSGAIGVCAYEMVSWPSTRWDGSRDE